MGWVVKSLRTDVLESLRRDAERDARRIRRGAGRVAGDVAEQLDALEALGLELRATVRSRRERGGPAPHPSLGAGPGRPAVEHGPQRAPLEAEPQVAPGAPRAHRPGRRASLHASPLSELLRATDLRSRTGGPVA
jgi:hypothetical protein